MPGDNNKMSDSQKLACKIVVGGAATGLGVITQNSGLLANFCNISIKYVLNTRKKFIVS